MPHLHIEHTANVPLADPHALLVRMNEALFASGQFAEEFDIKARVTRLEQFVVGTQPGNRGFVFVRLALLSGRSPEITGQLADVLVEIATDVFVAPPGLDLQFSVEIADLDREPYRKHRVAAAD